MSNKSPNKAVNKKSTAKKRTVSKKTVKKNNKTKQVFQKPNLFERIKISARSFLKRRPHRSFRLTDKSDYKRRFDIPGYFAFTGYVFRQLNVHRRTIILLIVVYASVIAMFGGITNQDMYNQIADYISQSGRQVMEGGFGAAGESLMVVFSAFLSGPGAMTPEQQVYLGLGLLMAWLATVWLLREYLAGGNPKLRDALYRSNAPFLSTFLVLLVLLVQMIPLAIVAAIYVGISTLGLLTEGLGMMLFTTLIALVAALVLYWMTSTIIALVIVTLPGMYPMEAMKAAGDMVVSRRLKILFRIIWLILVILLAWLVVMVPLTMLTGWLTSLWPWLSYVPVMPIFAAIMSSASIVFAAAYIYLMYRKLVDSE